MHGGRTGSPPLNCFIIAESIEVDCYLLVVCQIGTSCFRSRYRRMAVSATATRRQAFRGVLLDIASRLNEPDIQKLCFLCKDKISNQCKCRFPNHGRLVDCPYHHGPTGVLVMDQLLERGEFNEWKTEPLRDMLHQIGRVDLASTLLDDYDSVVETKPKGELIGNKKSISTLLVFVVVFCLSLHR